jgi:hypothetical protein
LMSETLLKPLVCCQKPISREGLVRRITPILVVGAILALPGAAHGVSLHGYSVRDAGMRIQHKITICAKKQWYYKTRMRLEEQDQQDVQTWSSDWNDRTQRVCNRVTFWHRDELEYEGWYYARMRVSIPGIGWVRYTGWREFWSS